ncbi:BolA family protein [Parapusillimonas granuli]|uniref:BolA family transcriptional regulator n=1 Tax=Parapusillimonas granuli TaxID=380911 RepID=A0A853G408_9BURK|nr:BolA family protein [Parapusillimonas granuli]MBB5216733.1 BolA protein [Parapusillimonas granuli]MEB2400062.1 BolA family transcriptional regulator [Alcaligenaceae bacterium]NYT51623.1 BolA family transcriptional regulator [Parapusillimonas granuli]
MSTDRKQLLKERLQPLAPTYLDIIDESHLHAGHEGSKSGASHFRLVIWTEQFNGLSTVARHRLVYDRVHDLMPYPIHALAIVAKNNS